MFHTNHFFYSYRRGLGSALLCLLLVMMPLPLHAAAGELDPTFGGDGEVITPLGANWAAILAMTLQPDGKLVVAGAITTAGNGDDFALMRYNSDGALDNTFDGDGQVLTDFGGYDQVNALVLQSDGKLVAAGHIWDPAVGYDFALARYNMDGSLDTTFGANGQVRTDFGGYDMASALVLQPDNKLVAAGTVVGGFGLARYNPDGALDTTFGDNGKVLTYVGGFDRAFALVRQSDGKLVAGGFGRAPGSSAYIDFALVRYNVDGSLDNTFDSDGIVFTNLGGHAYLATLLFQPDGKLVAAGMAWDPASNFDFALVRYNTDGSLDNTFDSDGQVRTDFGGYDATPSVVLQPDGKLVAAGLTCIEYSPVGDFALARYNADGSLDSTFDGDGKVRTDFGNYEEAHTLLLQPDGKLVAGGFTRIGSSYDFALARYLGDNTAPVAVDDLYNVGANAALNMAAPGVLGNDSDADGNALTALLVGGPSKGGLTLNADGSFIYTPNPAFSGVDLFTYQAKDGQATSNVATVIITVPSARERIDLLKAAVQQLVADGKLNQGQGNALLTKLANAQQQLAQGKTQQAINMLYAFSNQVTDLIATGVLTPEVGQPLLDAANVIMAQLQAGGGTTGSGGEGDQAGFTVYLPQVSR